MNRWCLRQSDGSTLNDDEVFRQHHFRLLMGLAYCGKANFVNVDGDWNCVGVLIPPGKQLGGLAGYLACWKDALWFLWKAGWRTSRVSDNAGPIAGSGKLPSAFEATEVG